MGPNVRTRVALSILLGTLCLALFHCTDPTGAEDVTEFKTITIRYERVLPTPDPGGLGQPVLSWLYYYGGEAQQGSPAMATVAENTFSVGVGIRTETPIALHVVDPQYPDWVRRRLFVEGADVQRQEIPAADLYGQVSFILGNDGILKSPNSN